MKLPKSLAELQDVVQNAEGHVRVVGRGHSFSPVSEVKGGTLVSLTQFAKVLDYKPPPVGEPGKFGSVTFEGGATFTELIHYLARQTPKAALRQVPSPLGVTAVGAMGTGTHGSGIKN